MLPYMGSEKRISFYEILGGGLVADVILWRKRHVTAGIILGIFSSCVVFQLSRYTLLSLVSRVLLLLVSIFFMWAKAAGVLHRRPPSIPELHVSKEVMNEAAELLRTKINSILSISRDVALGRESNLFYKVSACLWLTSYISSLTDFLTLAYTSLAVMFTIPVLYEKFEDIIEKYLYLVNAKVRLLYEKMDDNCSRKIKNFILDESKLS